MNSEAAAVRPDSAGTTRAWYALAILLIVYTFNYIDRYLLAGLAEPIKRDFGISDSYLGFLLGPAFAILYTTAAIPIARLADRHSRVMILSLGCAAWSLFTALSGFATGQTSFALMRLGVGLGEAAFLAPAYSLLADYFPPRRRAFAFAVLGLGIYLGQVGGLSAGPLLAGLYGWRSAFVITGVPGIALALLLYMTVAEPQRQQRGAQSAPPPAFGVTLKRLLARPSYRMILLGGALGTFSGMAFGLWGPTYFTRVLGMPIAQANIAFGLAFGSSGLIGMLAFGWLSDRLSPRNPAWPMRLAAGALLAATLFIMLVCTMTDPTWALLLAIPSGILGGGWSVGLLTSLQELVPSTIRATATALYGFALTFIGLVGGPPTVGFLSDLFHDQGTNALRYGLLPTLSVGIIGAILLLRGSRSLVTDAERLAAAEAGVDGIAPA